MPGWIPTWTTGLCTGIAADRETKENLEMNPDASEFGLHGDHHRRPSWKTWLYPIDMSPQVLPTSGQAQSQLA